MPNEKPQKRLKIMQGGRLRPFVKDQILTYNETLNVYYYVDSKMHKQRSPFTPEELESMHKTLVQSISADGLTLNEFRTKQKGLYQTYFKGSWIDCDTWSSSEHFFHLYRLKPQPEYIPVPEGVKLGVSGGRYFIVNGERLLGLGNDGLPVMGPFTPYPDQPHQIDPTPITEFEDGEIYFEGYRDTPDFFQGINLISNYFIYCKKENSMYGFPYEDTYATRFKQHPSFNDYRKVIPV